jgi:hypothetical protein
VISYTFNKKLKPMKKYIILSISLFALIVTSCKKKEEVKSPSNLYSEYEIVYDENTNKTTVTALFRDANAFGANVQLANSTDISFEGTTLDWVQFGSYYQKEFTGNKGSGNFKWKDDGDKEHNNYVLLVAAIGFSSIDTIHTSSNYNFQWLGLANATKQKVGLYIDGVSTTNLPLYYENTANLGNSLTLTSAQLITQGVGSAGFVMERSFYDYASDATKASGIIKSKYRALNKTIFLKP